MIDIKLLREWPEEVAKALAARGFVLDVENIKFLESKRKEKQVRVQELQEQKNKLSKEIGVEMKNGCAPDALRDEIKSIDNHLNSFSIFLTIIQKELQDLYESLPNIPHESVPKGRSEEDNQEERKWGEIPNFSFTAKDHVALGGDSLDFEAGAKLSGARFVVLKSNLARLHRALAQYMLDLHIEKHGYQEVYVPYLVYGKCLLGTGQFPKLIDDSFAIEYKKEEGSQTSREDNALNLNDEKAINAQHFLIPTSEVSVTNLARDLIFESEALPIKYVCHSPCFRKEAGSYGKDMKGMLRQHQFDKVEIVQYTRPEDSYQILEEMVKHAEAVLQGLRLPYRVMSLCTGDMGVSAAKTYDLEVWLPGQNRYREISSCSNTEAFQARRLMARWRNPATKKPEYLHTLNGSGVAVGRALIAVMENYQDAEGKIHVPEVLWPYMGGIKVI